MRRAGAIVTAAAAVTITITTAACGSTASGSSAPSAHDSASSPAQSQQVSRAQCQDKAALETSLTNLLQVSIGKGTIRAANELVFVCGPYAPYRNQSSPTTPRPPLGNIKMPTQQSNY